MKDRFIRIMLSDDYEKFGWQAGRMSRVGGFTLIELLVVMGIISLLVAILMPALNRARAAGKQTLCQMRLKQWGLAFAAYANENKDCYPHIDGLDRGNGAADEFGWVDMLPPLMDLKPWREYGRWEKPGVDTIFQCPAAKLAPENLYDYYPLRDGFFSYAMNSCLELDENCWSPHNDPTGNTMPSFLKSTLIQQPARVILLFDQLLDPRRGYGGDKMNSSAGKYCGSYPKAFSARHAKRGDALGGSILFCDSHVEWTETVWKEDWPEDLEVPPRGDINWYPYR
ncbi:MAG: type II secretion system protein [Sedimentisphaerales bacterium]|nr:type II secretion system protein [Sedimentisphaerales bacterium]